METLKPSTWGNVVLEIADAKSDGTFPTDLEQMGYIEEDTLTPNITEGDSLQLFESGHILRDEMKLEPEVGFNTTVIQIPEGMQEKFWDALATGTGENKKVRVKSMVNNKKFAIRISTPRIPGSETLEAPYCGISMTPFYDEKKGWSANLSISILKGPAEYFYDWGSVPAAPVEG